MPSKSTLGLCETSRRPPGTLRNGEGKRGTSAWMTRCEKRLGPGCLGPGGGAAAAPGLQPEPLSEVRDLAPASRREQVRTAAGGV